MSRRRIILLALVLVTAVGCAHGGIVNNTFVSNDYLFSVALPGPPYEQVAPKDALIALTDRTTGASIAIAASPDPYSGLTDKEKALDYTARDLFIFLTKKEYRTFEDTTLGGAPAKHVVVTGIENDTRLIFSAYVVRHYGQIYDIVLWCEPRYFDTASITFQKMVDSFTFLGGAGR
jgi:hypothetical protein